MRSVISLLAVVVIVLISYKLYFSQMGKESGSTASPVQTVDVVGVKNDLLAIAQAERAYQAEHGAYASLDELTSSGSLRMTRSGRGGYTYGVETSPTGFQVFAHCPAATRLGCMNYAVDQSMEVQPVP
jgi:hypothetical protein